MADGSGDCCVADPHLTYAEKIAAASNGFHAVGHGGGAVLFVQGCINRDVARWNLKRQFEDFQAKIKRLAYLVHGCAIGLEICHHLCGHGLRIGGDTLSDDTVVSSENGHDHLLHARDFALLPGGDPAADLLKASQSARRLGQLPVARLNCGDGLFIGAGQITQQSADIIKW
jgi:hypothetical protein